MKRLISRPSNNTFPTWLHWIPSTVRPRDQNRALFSIQLGETRPLKPRRTFHAKKISFSCRYFFKAVSRPSCSPEADAVGTV